MKENQKELTKEYIEYLLRKLDVELVERGQKSIIYVIGGANIAMSVDACRTTTDIDVVVKRGFDIVFEAAKAVAETEEGLADDWLNAQFTENTPEGGIAWQWFDNKDDDIVTTVYKGRGLIVELASPEMVLALKTIALRPQDIPDIYQLMRMTDIRTPEGIGRNLVRFTGRRIFDAQGITEMFIRIDPTFAEIFDNAPEDLRLPQRETLRARFARWMPR